MPHDRIVPCLWFDDAAEQAAEFYVATFPEALSLQLMCADQHEVDHFWAALSDGGEEGPCGWLKDPFGVSWQVVPEAVGEWMTHPDPGARARVFEAMLGMGKLDVAAVERALEPTTG